MPLPTAPFDAAKSIYAGLSIIQLKTAPAVSGVTAATDTLTKTAHGLIVGRSLTFVSGTGFTGLTAGSNYFVVSVPSADTFQVSATVGGSAIAVGTSSVGVFQPVLVFETTKITHKDGRTYKAIDRPDSKGASRPVRRFCVAGAEDFIYELDEAKRLVTDLFGGALSGLVGATATIWEPDPTDAAGKCALVSDTDFPCDVMRDADAVFGGGDATKVQIKVSSRKAGDVLWTPDATLT